MDDSSKISPEELRNRVKYAKARELLKQLLADDLIDKELFMKADTLNAITTKRPEHTIALQRLEWEKSSMIGDNLSDEYISLTDIARKHNEHSPSYVIQSWIRDSRTVDFLRLWEIENNKDFDEEGYRTLREALESNAITLTAKQWIEKTRAIGLISKQGKSGGTLAHPFIAVDFRMWLEPEFKFEVIKMFQGME